MTTITVEIARDKDLSAIKELIAKLGLKYNLVDNENLLYTDDVKNMLDSRYSDYLNGNVDLVEAEESKNKINKILNSQK